MVVNPYPPGGGGWFTPTGGTSWDANYAVAPPTAIALAQRPPTPPPSGGGGGGDAGFDAARWDAYVAEIRAALQASSGLERLKLQRQYEDAEKGRQNAYRIAQLSSETSRYGVDVGRQNLLEQLKEQQRQFDANHGLEIQKFGEGQRQFDLTYGLNRDRFGLERADAYTKYAQTYDDIWALQDFKGALGDVGQGRAPASVAASATQPHAKTWEDFAALAGYSGLPNVQSGQSMQPSEGAMSGGYSTRAPDGSVVRGGPTGQAGAGTDPRVSAASAVMKALPPSESGGTDMQDWAALNAIKSLYFGRKPGQVEALGPERRRIAQAGLRRAGYNPALVEEDRQRSLPGQGRPNAV